MQEPTVQGLSGFGLYVPSIEDAVRFYSAFGLEETDVATARGLSSPGRKHAEVMLHAGADKRLHHVSFHIHADEVDRFADKLRDKGIDIQDESPEPWDREGLWFQDPWGTWINLTPEQAMVREVPTPPPANGPGSQERVDVHLWEEVRKAEPPLRIGHMLLFTADWQKAEAFYQDTLGLRTSDRAEGKVAFMAAGDGIIDHHCFGLINSTHRGFQHASFQVRNMDDIGMGAWRMRDAGYKDGFGPGRHLLASNLFHYIRDPWGSWVEYYADMDKISPNWRANNFGELPYVWGPEWTPEFWGGEMNANHEPNE